MFEQGDVAKFHYLWHREAEKGEESGRKPRPVCIVIRVAGHPDVVFCFHSPPNSLLPASWN